MGRTGTNNDLKVVEVSPLVQEIVSGKFNFKIDRGYDFVDGAITRRSLYLWGDGIYPDLVIFAMPIYHADNKDESNYT